ncbi:MAG: type II toxin-antitoxin system VapC family toxin [bacterium]|nr:type II toxin-antitoxin system VapC family toxin [bacterium]
MRGLDTNVLVRYLTQDDPSQFAEASKLVEETESAGGRLYVNKVVLCELTWVLRGSRYGFDRPVIAEVIERLLEVPVFELEDRDEVAGAVAEYRAGKADFADYLIGQHNLAAGCEDTVTFDTRTGDSEAFEVLAGATSTWA